MSRSAVREDRRWVIPAVLAIIILPLLLVLLEAVTFHVENRNNGTLVSSGKTREYLLYVPATYDRRKLTPLMISMHGAGMLPAFQRDTSGWNKLADEYGFIVVYPAGRGVPKIFPMDGWRTPSQMPDVRFISALIDTLTTTYNIDPARIYADGLSNGGGMAFVLSCTLSGKIAAVGLVASAQLLPWKWCTETRPMPMIALHGTADTFTPYDGGKTFIHSRPFPSIPGWATQWAKRNQCAANQAESMVAADVKRRAYTNCADHADVVLYTILGGGHTWPGGALLPEWFVGKTNYNIDASRVEWAFFLEHPLSRK